MYHRLSSTDIRTNQDDSVPETCGSTNADPPQTVRNSVKDISRRFMWTGLLADHLTGYVTKLA